jgi:predicted TIM-barrel fold metal-dependent hydrolase
MAPAANRIDVHFHAVPPVFREALSSLPADMARSPAWTPELALEMMQRNDIASAILSISTPGAHHGDDAKAGTLCRHCNDYFAGLRTGAPKRFGAFAAVPLPDVKGARTEIAYALDVLKLDGVGLFTNYGGKHLGDPEFDPVLAELNERAAVAFIHPTSNACCQGVQPNLPASLIEYLFDSTRVAVNLILSGAMDRFPRIRFILSHAGGTLPYVAWRVANVVSRQLSQPARQEQYPLAFIAQNAGQLSADLVRAQFKRFWYDTALSGGPETFGSLNAIADPARIVFGSDWPYVGDAMTTAGIDSLNAPGLLSPTQLAAINRGNALQLFPRLA